MGSSSESPRLHGHAALSPRGGDAAVFAFGAAAAVLVVLLLVLAPAPSRWWPAASPFPAQHSRTTFYDDPELSYAVDRRVTGWDAKRAAWLRSRGFRRDAGAVVMVSGSQPAPCRAAGGDHLLLRFLKNKLDYCRLHGIELLYNRALLHPDMPSYWAKIPVLRAAMLAHPEAEWLWWVDSDAVFTDMDFALPLKKYSEHNLVLYGWPKEVYEKGSWVGLNAGVFLIRNCQWSMDFMDAWAAMGPTSPEYAKWGRTLRAELAGKRSDDSDDQSALVYLLLKHRDTWGDKTHIASDYYFQGYWLEIVGHLDGVAKRYEAVESAARGRALRRRHAEREHAAYAAARSAAVRAVVPGPNGGGQGGWRRPFVTHFTGCAPCSGKRDPAYSAASCGDGMRAALDFADDQVLPAYGFCHVAPGNDSVTPLPFDYPAAAPERSG